MAATYDISSTQGKVRLKISDVGGTTGDEFIFQDDEIQAFLDMAGGNIALAAASALRTIATNEALVQKRIKFLELSTDGSAIAKELRELAATFAEEAETGGDDEDWDPIVEMPTTAFARREQKLGY